MIITYQLSVPTTAWIVSPKDKRTVYLEGVFLWLAVITVLLQVADRKLLQW